MDNLSTVYTSSLTACNINTQKTPLPSGSTLVFFSQVENKFSLRFKNLKKEKRKKGGGGTYEMDMTNEREEEGEREREREK